MRVAVLYIPGLGDGYDGMRQIALHYWKSDEVTIYFVAMKWSRKMETYDQKYTRIMKQVHNARQTHDKIVLIGESAGGAMALYTLHQAASEIDQVVTLCGYNYGASGLALHHKVMHPAFYSVMPHVDKIVESMTETERSKIMTFYSQHDRIVKPNHTLLAGTKAQMVSTSGHIRSIAWMLITKTPLRVVQQGV